jgi:hypothetical protein
MCNCTLIRAPSSYHCFAATMQCAKQVLPRLLLPSRVLHLNAPSPMHPLPAQLYRTGRFQLYDYGSAAANAAAYGGEETPLDVAAHYSVLGSLPVAIMAGRHDGIIPAANVRCHYEAMLAAGVPASYREVSWAAGRRRGPTAAGSQGLARLQCNRGVERSRALQLTSPTDARPASIMGPMAVSAATGICLGMLAHTAQRVFCMR